MSDKPKARLIPAFEWCCDSCGTRNFASAVVVEGKTKEEHEEALRRAHGLSDFEPIPDELGGQFLLAPDRVTCSSCGASFETEEDTPCD